MVGVGDAELKRRLTLNCTFDTRHLLGLHWGVSDHPSQIANEGKKRNGLAAQTRTRYSPGKISNRAYLRVEGR